MNQPDERERAILLLALKLPPEDQSSFLHQISEKDPELGKRLVRMLQGEPGGTVAMSGQPEVADVPGASDMASPADEPGEKADDMIGRYLLLEKIGEGGMGSVWAAEQRETVRRKVALKVIKLGMDTREVIRRFEAERQLLALMDHPNIAKVLDVGATDMGRPFFVMEMVNGIRLTDYCDRHQRSTHQRLELFVQVCKAVEHAHQKGVIQHVHLLKGDLDWIVMKCLEKDRTRRYQSAAHLADDIQRHFRNEPILARPPSAFYRSGRWMRRNRAPVTTAFVTFLLLGLATGWLWLTKPDWLSGRSSDPRVLLNRAEARLQQHDREGFLSHAISDLHKALKSEPENAQARAKLAWAYWLRYVEEEREEIRSDAAHWASNAIHLNPNSTEGHLVRGLVAASQANWTAATNDLNKARALTRSANGVVLISLASALRSAGNHSEATNAAALAEEAGKNSWDVLSRVGVFHAKGSQGTQNLAQAFTVLKQAVALAPESPLAHRYLGSILVTQGRHEEAMKEFQESLKLRPTARTLSDMGSVHYRAKNWTKAADSFLEASKLDPARFLYRVNAGRALLALQEPDRSAEITNLFT